MCDVCAIDCDKMKAAEMGLCLRKKDLTQKRRILEREEFGEWSACNVIGVQKKEKSQWKC